MPRNLLPLICLALVALGGLAWWADSSVAPGVAEFGLVERSRGLGESADGDSAGIAGVVGSPGGTDEGPGLAESHEVEAARGTIEVAAAPLDASVERTLWLRVVAGTERDPVPRAEVARLWVAGERLREGWTTGQSDDDGLCEVTWRGPAAIDLQVECDGYLPGRFASLVEVQGASAKLQPTEVLLERAATVVVTPVGFPLEVHGEASLWFAKSARGRSPDMRLPWTGGTVTFEGVRPGHVSAVLAVLGQPPSVALAQPAPAGVKTSIVVEPRGGEEIRGRVNVRQTGQPFEGVVVEARPQLDGVAGDVGARPYPPVNTGPDGSFVIAGIPRGEVTLRLTSPFGAQVERKLLVVPANQTRQVTLAMSGAARLSGQVLAEDGTAPAGLQVAVVATVDAKRIDVVNGRIVRSGAPIPVGVEAEVAAHGRFSAGEVPAGRALTVFAIAEGFGLVVQDLKGGLALGEERTNVDLKLLPLEPSRFRVVDPNGVAVDEIEIRLRQRSGGRSVWRRPQASTAELGIHEVNGQGLPVLSVRIDVPGFERLESAWPGDETIPTFELERSHQVEFKLVVEGEGRAIKRGRIVATPVIPGAAEPRNADERKARNSARRASRSDSFGRVTLSLDPALEWSVRGEATGFERGEAFTVPSRRDESSFTVPLVPRAPVPLARIDGRVLRWGNGAPVPALRFEGLRGGSAVVEDGQFALVGIEPGRVAIVAHSPGFETVRLPVSELRPGESLDVGELRSRGATEVEVTVLTPAGRPARDARVRLERLPTKKGGRDDLPRRLTFPGKGDGRGAYKKTAVARVKWRLVVERKGARRHVEIVRVKGSRAKFKVQLKAAGS